MSASSTFEFIHDFILFDAYKTPNNSHLFKPILTYTTKECQIIIKNADVENIFKFN